MQEIAILLHTLEDEYTSASWTARHVFAPPPSRSRIPRVPSTDFKRISSPLVQEVQPDDVVLRPPSKQWIDMDHDDYDGDYVASTDPLHPVCTEYVDLMGHDTDDDSWVGNHLALADEIGSLSVDDGVDVNGTKWVWSEEKDDTGGARNCFEGIEERGSDYVSGRVSELLDPTSLAAMPDIMPGHLNAASPPPLGQETCSDELEDEQIILAAQVRQAVEAFWKAVNGDASVGRQLLFPP